MSRRKIEFMSLLKDYFETYLPYSRGLSLIIPEHFEPLNRILRATIPERESQLKSIILFSVDYLQEHYL